MFRQRIQRADPLEVQGFLLEEKTKIKQPTAIWIARSTRSDSHGSSPSHEPIEFHASDSSSEFWIGSGVTLRRAGVESSLNRSDSLPHSILYITLTPDLWAPGRPSTEYCNTLQKKQLLPPNIPATPLTQKRKKEKLQSLSLSLSSWPEHSISPRCQIESGSDNWQKELGKSNAYQVKRHAVWRNRKPHHHFPSPQHTARDTLHSVDAKYQSWCNTGTTVRKGTEVS